MAENYSLPRVTSALTFIYSNLTHFSHNFYFTSLLPTYCRQILVSFKHNHTLLCTSINSYRISNKHTNTVQRNYIYVYIHTHTYIYIHIYIHTHIHTYTRTYVHIYMVVCEPNSDIRKFELRKQFLEQNTDVQARKSKREPTMKKLTYERWE
jgi:hypothetical protein